MSSLQYHEMVFVRIQNQLKVILKIEANISIGNFIFCYLISDTTLETNNFLGSFFSKFNIITLPSKQDDLLLYPRGICEPVCLKINKN